ncbi:MAG: O-antigen ligase family protein [Pseudomonadota bacterium]
MADILATVFTIVLIFLGVVFFGYRAGVWFAVLLLPFSATYLIPRQMFGVVGLNPLNVTIVVTLIVFFFTWLRNPDENRVPRIPIILLIYLTMLLIAAGAGLFFIDLAPPQITPQGTLVPLTALKYLLEDLFKPMVILIVAFFAGVMVYSGRDAKSLLWAMAAALMIFAIIIMVYIAGSGVSLKALASSRSRGFLSWMGMHANELGLLLNMGAAIMLFSFLEARHQRGRTLLLLVAGSSAVTAALTFSRGAFLGLLFTMTYYLITRRRFRELFVGLTLIIAVAISIPEAFIERASTGIEKTDIESISAGRVDGIWKLLFPVFLDSPIWGHGLSSTLWAEPNRKGMRFGHPHSAYLAVLLDFGLLGAVLIAAFFMYMWKLFRRLKHEHPEALWRGFFEGASVSLLLLLVQGLTGDRFVPTFPQVLLWIAFAMAIGFASRLWWARNGKRVTSGGTIVT